MKRIWIVNYYTTSNSSNPRYIELAKHFREAGYDVITFNATTAEKIKSSEIFLEKSYDESKFIHVKTPDYVGNGIARLKSIWAFAWTLYRNCKKFEHPDIVLHNLHTPFDYPIYWMAKKLKVKYIAEAWDMWPENFVTFGLISPKNPIMKVAYWIERHIYERADKVIFTFEGGLSYLQEKGWSSDKGGKIDVNKIHYNNNGVNLEKFDKDVVSYPRLDEEYKDTSTYKIIYMGAIRLANNVKTLIDAAAILKDNPKYKFLIYGDGNEREYLLKYVKDHNIDNVIFKERRIPLCEVAWVVSQATVNIMNYQKNFGIHGVSSGKMFQYFAAGKPICCNIKLNFSEISRRNLGIDRDLNTPEQYAEAIRTLAEQPAEMYAAMCKRVREAGKAYDYKVLAQRELEIIES